MEHPEARYTTYDVFNANGIVQVYPQIYIWCIDGDPTKAIFYVGTDNRSMSVQGNTNQSIAERIQPPHRNKALVFFEKAYIPWRD